MHCGQMKAHLLLHGAAQIFGAFADIENRLERSNLHLLCLSVILYTCQQTHSCSTLYEVSAHCKIGHLGLAHHCALDTRKMVKFALTCLTLSTFAICKCRG